MWRLFSTSTNRLVIGPIWSKPVKEKKNALCVCSAVRSVKFLYFFFCRFCHCDDDVHSSERSFLSHFSRMAYADRFERVKRNQAHCVWRIRWPGIYKLRTNFARVFLFVVPCLYIYISLVSTPPFSSIYSFHLFIYFEFYPLRFGHIPCPSLTVWRIIFDSTGYLCDVNRAFRSHVQAIQTFVHHASLALRPSPHQQNGEKKRTQCSCVMSPMEPSRVLFFSFIYFLCFCFRSKLSNRKQKRLLFVREWLRKWANTAIVQFSLYRDHTPTSNTSQAASDTWNVNVEGMRKIRSNIEFLHRVRMSWRFSNVGMPLQRETHACPFATLFSCYFHGSAVDKFTRFS